MGDPNSLDGYGGSETRCVKSIMPSATSPGKAPTTWLTMLSASRAFSVSPAFVPD
ncbi:MAG: hypothetical protein ING66_13710 [Rhodocyclaceae bacterium]|nr:hypothetical protein [Rhodocyclaceae bacterium]MCE2722575.1 hypothetical protein [Betaproteobacteria bacterium]MCA3017632.1 hypothetical protein [Rhodocyclaceae bacterium]MCA3023094.1 hypothetical protein [Rhodocyclaceae bacterium]MCA3025578.1 hypothetical protein [Rhodocyclaceae bacterium]